MAIASRVPLNRVSHPIGIPFRRRPRTDARLGVPDGGGAFLRASSSVSSC